MGKSTFIIISIENYFIITSNPGLRGIHHWSIIVIIYTVMAKNISTLGKYDQRRLWKLICIVNPFDLLLKIYIFETSICQINSSTCSPIMPNEVREHLIRDQRPFLHPESLQILQIHSSMTVLLLFSSPHSFSTGFRTEDWNGHSRSLVLCSVTHFCVVFEVCVWIIVRLEDPNMAHYKISNRVSHLLIFPCI